eukprot:g45887.t1
MENDLEGNVYETPDTDLELTYNHSLQGDEEVQYEEVARSPSSYSAASSPESMGELSDQQPFGGSESPDCSVYQEVFDTPEELEEVQSDGQSSETYGRHLNGSPSQSSDHGQPFEISLYVKDEAESPEKILMGNVCVKGLRVHGKEEAAGAHELEILKL